MLINLFTGYWETQLKMMNLRVDEENGKSLLMLNGGYRNVCRFSSNKFWKNIGCIDSYPTFGRGAEAMVEVRDNKYKWKEEEEAIHLDKI